MGHVRKRVTSTGKVRYQARVSTPAGERVETFDRRGQATAWIAEQEAALQTGGWADPHAGRQMFGDYADEWFKGLRRSPGTVDNTERRLRLHVKPTFGAMPAASIRPAHVRSWVSALLDKGLSSGEVKACYFLFAKLCKLAVTDGVMPRTPCVAIDLPKDSGSEEQTILDADQVVRLADAIAEPWRALVWVGADTGLRPGELYALTAERIDLLRRRISVVETLSEVNGRLYRKPTKTYETRVVTMSPFTAAVLTDHVARHLGGRPETNSELGPVVFASPTGKELRRRNFMRRIWRPAVDAAQLASTLRLYDLRHTHAATCILNGAHVKEIQERLGHSSSRVTLDVYGHLFPSLEERLVDRLDGVWRSAASSGPVGGGGRHAKNVAGGE